VTPRDLLGLAASLASVHAVREMMHDARADALVEAVAALDPLPAVQARITATIGDEPPLTARAGNVIRTGYDARVDELRTLAHQGKRFISELEASERSRSGISSLKVRYNNVFGYYIEVTKPNLHLVPSDYTRKQTVANAERFVTPELSEHESQIASAEERRVALELSIFDKLRTEVGAVAVSDDFLEKGAIVLTKGRNLEETQRSQARPGDITEGKAVTRLALTWRDTRECF
jgi:DNA mismatch repair protein MutS